MIALSATVIALCATPAHVRAMQTPLAYAAQASAPQGYEFQVRDVVYQRNGNKVRVARLYQPAGTARRTSGPRSS